MLESHTQAPESSYDVALPPDLDCVHRAVMAVANHLKLPLTFTDQVYEAQVKLTGPNGLPAASLLRYMDWFVSRSFDIDGSLYNRNCIRGEEVTSDATVFAMEEMVKHGPGVYLVITEDASMTGHCWPCYVVNKLVFCLTPSLRGFYDCNECIHNVVAIRKCAPNKGTDPPTKKATKRRRT